MKKFILLVSLSTLVFLAKGQSGPAYFDSVKAFQTRFVDKHEVVKGDDRKYIQFYPIDSAYRVESKFVRTANAPWFKMNTTSRNKQVYRKYGELIFSINGKMLHLFAYQSQYFLADKHYDNYLFAPFTDSSSGEESYGAGRYLDISILDIRDSTLVIDFNKAYNPYCAYTDGYECPLPPKENDLPVYIRAGEKNFGKAHH